MEWYELNEEDKIKNFYSKYTIQDFWDWWSDGYKLWMEIRTQDWNFAKELGTKFNLFYSHTGVFVNNVTQLKQVILYARTKQNIWFGIQPRKWGYNKFGKKTISGGDNFVECIKFIFIDIDRKVKEEAATPHNLREIDIVSNAIINKFNEFNLCKSYLKIASGNGVQLLIKLDIPIVIPKVDYIAVKDKNGINYTYVTNVQFDKTKKLLGYAIGIGLIKFVRKFCKQNKFENTEIDKAGFRMAQVGALPFTKNYKYDGHRWRGILTINKGVNEGLSDYMLGLAENIYVNEEKVFGGYVIKKINKEEQLVKGRLREHKLIKFMLENKLPEGERNNYLWFQVKCLLRDYKIDLNSKEFKTLHKELEVKFGKLTLNLPSKNLHFDSSIVNAYCIHNLIPPIYNLWENKNKRVNNVNIGNFDDIKIEDSLILDEGTDIIKDMANIKFEIDKIYNNINIDDEAISYNVITMLKYNQANKLFNKFVGGCIKKYGITATKYYYTYLFDRYLNCTK